MNLQRFRTIKWWASMEKEPLLQCIKYGVLLDSINYVLGTIITLVLLWLNIFEIPADPKPVN